VISHAQARRIVDVVTTELESRDLAAAVAVVDPHGELIAFLRTDGCPLASIDNAVHKAFTAARERVPSHTLGQRSRDETFPMTNFGDLRYTGWGGGVPVVSDGSVVGAVGVSGLVEDLDMELANRGAECLDGL